MNALRHLGPLTIIVLLAVLLAACGGTTTPATTTTNQGTNNGTTAAKTNTGNVMTGTMTQGITITPDMGGMNALIRTGKATIDGNAVNVLLTNKGFAVYTYKPDTAFKATCTDACAKDWPPILAPQGVMTVTSSVTLPKQLSIHQTVNGAQIFYDGHALYTYAEDKQAGNAMGHGQDMQWYLIDPMLTNMTMPNTGAMTQGITIMPDVGTMGAFIHTGKATINNNQVTVLLTNKDFALYTYKPDAPLTATCTGACAKDWPPLLAPQGMMTVSSAMTLPSQLSVHQTANGAQVFYNGHALYLYAADTQAGNAMGDGQDMQWYLVNSVQTAAATTNMMQGITVTLGTTGNMGAFIHTGKAAINGNQVNVLLTNKGFALYYYKPDTTFKATCTGACAKDWPPLLAPQGMMTVSSAMTLPRQLSVHQTPNGAQVFYDGHALYLYAQDTQAGNAQGRGQDMLWYMVGFLL